MQVDIWHIDGDAFHFGRHGLGQEESRAHLPSDSLLAALLARLAQLRGPAAVDELARALQQDPPPFVLSSAFPRAAQTRFFPAPLQRGPAAPGADPAGLRPKDLKQVRFVSEAIFRQLLQGRSLAQLLNRDFLWTGSQALMTAEEEAALPRAINETKLLWQVEKRPRVTVGRDRHNSQIYFTGRTVYPPEGGLWFAVRLFDLAHAPLLEELFIELGVAGLGGERSSGFGACRITHQGALELPEPGEGYWVTLSRYWPQADEMGALQAPGAAYAVESVGGWVTSPVSQSQRRRAARLLSEGSVLGPAGRAVPGQIVDVQPDYNGTRPLGHPVWRSGRALAAGFSLPGGAS
jgi:CRISPR-associated protein Csm4